MATEALTIVKQLKNETGNLRKLADDIPRADITKEFSDLLGDVMGTLASVNQDLCVGCSAFVHDYDILLTQSFATFMTLSNEIGGEIAEQAALVQQAFQVQRAFISIAAECKQPNQSVLQELLKPTSNKLEEIQEYRDRRRASKLFNLFSAVSEAIPMLAWVTVAPKPAPYVRDMIGSAQFYTNRVLKEYKETMPTYAEWSRTLIKVIQDLEAYVKKHHLTGLTWNRQGKDAAPTASAPTPPPPGVGPPPPPPPPVEAPSAPAAPASSDDAGRAALFADLNKGTDVTRGLKKVTDDMKTHKNPELKKAPKPVSSTPKPYKAPAAAVTKPVSAPGAAIKKPPRMELVQKKWDVEYFENNPGVIVEGADMKQTVYVYKCQNSTIQIPAKVNSITLDGCKKVGLAFESVVGSVDIVNCQSVRIQVLNTAQIINVDKTDGCMIYLGEESKKAEIISAKSSEMNVLIPTGDGDWTEFPLPEQYRSVYNGKNFTTTCVESLG